jgi:hypothetical protein
MLAIYLVAEEVPQLSLRAGTARPEGWKLKPRPEFSDFDFLDYNPTNHAFTVTLDAARRVDSSSVKEGLYHLSYLEIPFVVVAGGERIYLGMCWSPPSSRSYGVPVMIWGAQVHTRGPTDAVEFQIALAGSPWNPQAVSESDLNDKRILEAVKWIKKQNKPVANGSRGTSVKKNSELD